jgi:hypothetical protein
MKKYVLTSILALFFILTTSQIVFAESPAPSASAAPASKGGILTEVRTTNQNEALTKADDSTKKIVEITQGFGTLGAIIMICWIGYTLGINGGNANALAQMKTRIVFFILGLYIAFFPVTVLGALFGIFGYSFK